jgi:electron transport complex protein RnfG
VNRAGDRRLHAGLAVILVAACLAVILATVSLTQDRIEDNQRRTVLKVMGDIIPAPYDNDPLADARAVRDRSAFGRAAAVKVYTARQDGRVRGFVFMPVTATGYNGAIRLAVGIQRGGRLSGVRVLEQHETPGLGAAVDQRVSDWIHMFSGRSLENTPPGEWTVKDDGGDFDQLSGATITSHGVINRVRAVLDYYGSHRTRLLQENPDNAD